MAVERSMTALESGRTTGSDMGVIMMGSMNSSGTLLSQEEKLPRRKPWLACSCTDRIRSFQT